MNKTIVLFVVICVFLFLSLFACGGKDGEISKEIETSKGIETSVAVSVPAESTESTEESLAEVVSEEQSEPEEVSAGIQEAGANTDEGYGDIIIPAPGF